MRHSIKRVSKSALSVILALMMIVSTMVVGIITVSAFDLKGTYNFDNYTAKWDKVYLVKVGNDGSYTEYQAMTAGSDGIYSYTLGSWGGSSFYFANSNSNPTATTAKFTSAVNSTNNCFVPSSATGTSITGTWMTTAQAIQQHGGGETETAKFNGGDVYYLQPNDSYWNQAGAWFAICLQSPISGSTDKTFVKMDQVTGASPVTYKVTIPDGGWNNMDFVRMNKDKTELSYHSKWNSAYTGSSGVGYPSGTQNCLQITGWDNSGTWSTFVDKKDLAVPTVTLTTNGVITSDTPVTLNITSSGDAYPNGATFELVNSSGTTIDNITLSLGDNTLRFTDNIPDGNYTVKVSAGDDYNPASSDEFALSSVQLYAITLVDNVANLLSITSSPATSTYEGNTVKVTVTPDTGYECTGLTVTGNSTVPVTKNDDGTYSFTMPGEAVTVTPTISAKTVANITVSSNNVEYGTAVLSTSGTIYVGDTFDVTVTPATNYALSGFTITGGSQGATSGNITTFTATEQNVSVTANFTENKGVLCDNKFIVYGTTQNPNEWGISNGTQYLDVYYNSTDNAYYATIPYNVFSGVSNLYFALSSSKTDINQLWWRTNVPNTKTINVSEDDPNSAIKAVRSEWNNYKDGNNGQFVQLSEILDTVTAVNVKIEISAVDGATDNQGTYTITPVLETVPEGRAKVYAKDGTYISKNGSTSGTFNYGDTKVVTSDTVTLKREDTAYNIYSAEKDSYLTIQTTMGSTYSGYGFYVYAFCINGESYPAVAKAGGVYETTYKVTGEEEGNIVEITPVYYNTKIEKEGDYITVYVDASQLKGKWGNTISCYSYYYTGTYTEGKPNAYETTKYPGQPMLLGSNGLYYTRVPRYAYSNGTKIEKSTGVYYPISGVTLNSFSESELHGTLYSYLNGKNYQTYDYDDFKYIADLGFDTVKFVIEYRDKTTNQLTLLDKANNHPDKSGSDITPSVYEGQNGWNDFYDFDGNLTDILGNVLTAEQKTQSPIYIVSTGNQNTSMGEWSTVWYVFDQNGEYVTQGLPSDFIPRNTDGGTATNTKAYQDIEKAKLTGVPVKICYESQQDASTSTSAKNTGVRVDGRWYYTTSKQETPVDVKVQYTDDINTGVWTIDTTGISGTATIDGVTEKVFTDRNVTAQLDAVAKSGYIFVEWGTVDDNGEYTKLSNIKSASAEFMIDTSYHLVARFAKVEDGSLVITHEKYTGPNYIGGGGYYYVSAVVYNADGTVNSTYDLTEGSITIPELASLKDSNCTIEITMVTKMKGENTFIDWYMLTPEGDYDNITQNEAAWGATGEVSQTITVVVDDLYSGSELVVNTLQYYSDIAPVTKNAILYYKYYNRFGDERTYTKVVELKEDYLTAHPDYYITDDLIYENAPAVEDLYKDCTWTITDQKVTRQGTTATLWGTHQDAKKQVHLSFGNLSGDGITDVDTEVTYNEYLLKDPKTDEFYRAPATGLDSENNEASFAYWIVKEKGTEKEVARCYSRDFNLRIVDHYDVTAIYSNDKENVVTISDPKFTREQFTDSSGNIKTDYLYADFIVAYMGTDNVLLNSDAGKNYHTGLIVEYGKDTKITVDPENDDKVGSTYNGTFTTYNGFTNVQIKDIATDSEKKHESITIKDNQYAAHKFVIDNSKYNNFNRLDYYVQFNNNKNIRHYIMKAYYYVYQTDANGEVIEGTYKVTEPVYFCYYNIGNSATKTETSNV